jgi:hypothetical protein
LQSTADQYEKLIHCQRLGSNLRPLARKGLSDRSAKSHPTSHHHLQSAANAAPNYTCRGEKEKTNKQTNKQTKKKQKKKLI